MAEIKYDYKYFHNVLLRLKSVNYTRYQHITEKDLLIQALNGEEITDHSKIDWIWLIEDLCSPGTNINPIVYFDLDDKLEEFISHIVPRTERVRILTYLREHCRECLFYEYNYDDDCIEAFETECARLISVEIEQSKYDQYHGDFLDWPIPDLKEIALPKEKKPEYSIMETAILRAIPNYSENNPPITKDILLQVAYEFIDYFRASVKTFNENGRDNRYKPCMSYKEQADKIYNQLIKRANRYLYWNRTPVYQVFFILGCLMGLPDHRRSWHEEKFAEGIGDYLEMTDHFRGSKEKIKNVIQGLLTLSQYQLDFDMENVEDAMNEQTEQLKKQQEEQEAQRLPKPETNDTPPTKPTQEPLSIEKKAVQQFVNKLNTLAQMLHKEWDGKKVPTGLHQPDAVIRINTEGISQFLNEMLSNEYDALKELCYPPTSNSKQKFVQFVIKLRKKGYLGELPNNLLAKQLAPIVELSEGTVKNYLSKMS